MTAMSGWPGWTIWPGSTFFRLTIPFTGAFTVAYCRFNSACATDALTCSTCASAAAACARVEATCCGPLCAVCHSAKPTDPTIKAAPKGIELETLDELKRYASQIETQAVKNKAMPLGNRTDMTLEERAKLGAWIAKQ